MSEVFAMRQAADGVRLQFETALADADSREVGLQNLRKRIEDGTFEGVHGHSPEEWLEIKEGEQQQRRDAIEALIDPLAEIIQTLNTTLDQGKPLFRQGNAEPIALLPVRLETRFADEATIQVRIYPDDLHIDAFDPRLTPAELEAARAYWRDPGDAAWQELLTRLSPARAAWATRATRKGAPEPELREDGERAEPQVSTLPSRWRFIGLLGGEVVVDERGKEIPTPLPLGVLVGEGEGANREHATWLVEYKAAVQVGMAKTLKLPEGVDRLDELFVVGVQQSAAADASKRLRDTLRGQAFGAGLGFLAPGTPTNNTPQSRSGWSSRPQPKPPGVEPPKLEPGTDAARLASALGLPKAAFLGECAGGGDSTEEALAGLTLLSWGAFGQGMVDGAHGSDLITLENLPVDGEAWRGVRDHLARFVRSRGPLPTIRVANQPYGVLPATSLDEWTASQGPTALIAFWLLRLRHHWRAALAPGWIPRVTDGVAADRTAVDVLSRLPAATDLVVRRLLSPRAASEKLGPKSSGPVLSVGGLAAGANLRWTMPTELTSSLSFTGNATKPDHTFVTPRLDPEPGNYTEVLSASRRLWTDALAVVQGTLAAAEYEQRWPLPLTTRGEEPPPRPDTIAAIVSEGQHPGFVPAMLHPDNWAAWPQGDTGPDDPLRMALDLPGTVDSLVTMELDPAAGGDAQLRAETLAFAKRCAKEAPRVIAALAALERTPPEQLLRLAFEVMDVYSHRLDAWITSLATRRLLAMRDKKETAASRLGGYGWVENLRRDPEPELADVDGYIHAPSLHHAATAAVLRSGFRAHQGEETLAVNLTSRRARVARWLLGGVRRGQELGALLGYRFERALHEGGHDDLIEGIRKRYPIQVAPEPQDGAEQPERWQRSTEAIAARNVVDGMALARDATNATATFPAAEPMIADLVDALDAVGDLLLAESVHHLVGGNPMRAGVSADSLGRGEDVPDRFDVLRTPNRGRALTHRVAAVLPADPADVGWAADALSALEPRVEAWVADALGPPSGRRLTGVVVDAKGGERPFDHSADKFELSALSTALEVAGADHARLDDRVRELEHAPGATVRYEGAGWRELLGVAARVRSLLASAQPLLPSHLAAGADSIGIVPDLAGLRKRLATFVATLPDRDKAGSPAARLAELAQDEADPRWLKNATTALAEVLGSGVPLVPLLAGADLGTAPAKAGGAELADWVRRVGSVRPAVSTWHELLLLTGAQSGRACALSASQAPLTSAAEPWIGGSFPPTKRPAARQQVVYHTPSPLPASGPLAGIVFDEWVEVLPGSDALAETKLEGEEPVPAESELTGLSFHFDRPDAKAPQAILIAVPPNTERGWTEDGLALVVRDTLELAKLRAVDLGDLPLLDDVLPALRLNGQSPLGSLAFDYWKELAE